jgi:hypothetical protein
MEPGLLTTTNARAASWCRSCTGVVVTGGSCRWTMFLRKPPQSAHSTQNTERKKTHSSTSCSRTTSPGPTARPFSPTAPASSAILYKNIRLPSAPASDHTWVQQREETHVVLRAPVAELAREDVEDRPAEPALLRARRVDMPVGREPAQARRRHPPPLLSLCRVRFRAVRRGRVRSAVERRARSEVLGDRHGGGKRGLRRSATEREGDEGGEDPAELLLGRAPARDGLRPAGERRGGDVGELQGGQRRRVEGGSKQSGGQRIRRVSRRLLFSRRHKGSNSNGH